MVLLCCDCSNRIRTIVMAVVCIVILKIQFLVAVCCLVFAFCDLVPDSRVEFRVTRGERFQAMLCGCLFLFFSIYKWVKVLKEDLISIGGRSRD